MCTPYCNRRYLNGQLVMDKSAVLRKIFWHLDTPWRFRHQPAAHDLSVRDTIKGLQALLLADAAAMLAQTLERVFARSVAWSELARLDIALYQEGMHQRVWRAQTRLVDGTTRAFGLIAARHPEASNQLTQRDFQNLQVLYARQTRYCAQPYVCGLMPLADGIAAYTVEWLEQYKELVFEIAHNGGVFLVNARDAHQFMSPQESRQIWRCIIEILWWYADVRQVNIQAGDFVGCRHDHGEFALKLTTARELVPVSEPAARIHTLLRSVITASGYLSDGRQPFDRSMSEAVFFHRMHAVLQRRFGHQAASLARQQWAWFQHGCFAQQEDWLKEDCIIGTYNRWRADAPAVDAWHITRQDWLAYAEAVQAGQYPPSWWFPAAEIPTVLTRLAQRSPA